MLTKELEGLIAAAGRAEADEKRRAADDRARDVRERAKQVSADARAESDAATNAEVIFAWVVSAEAEELRKAMRVHGLDRVRLGWALGIVDGEWRRADRGFGSVSVDILADGALHVVIVRGHHGGGSRRVTSAAMLADIVPARALATLADEMRHGRADDLLREGLAAILGGDGRDGDEAERPR